MGWIILILINLGLFWIIDLFSSIAAWTLAVPIGLFLFLTRAGYLIRRGWNRAVQLNYQRLWAWIDGFGPPGSRRNTVRAFTVYANTRSMIGECETQSEDIDWARANLRSLTS